MSDLAASIRAAEAEWLERWVDGPTELDVTLAVRGSTAPDLELLDDRGQPRAMSEFWADGPALLLFWRHFGCSCGADRGKRLSAEVRDYAAVGLTPVIIAQGEPERAADYKARHGLQVPILCDPGYVAYRSYGVGHWPAERVLYDASEEFWAHRREVGVRFQDARRQQGRPPVDDPWRATAEFVITPQGVIALAYAYQYCEDFPDPRVFTTVASIGRGRAPR